MAIPQAELDAIDAVQKKTFTGFNLAYKNQDYQMLVETFTEDCTFVPPGSGPIKGRDGVKKMCEGMHKAGVADIKITKAEARPVGEYIFKFGEADMFDKDNKKVDVTNFAQIWRKDGDGQYRHWFEMINSQAPPKPPSS